MKDSLSVAVVIPALNEERAIGHVLARLPNWIDTIIVADNGSSDATAEVARRGGARVVYEPRRGYGAACLRALTVVGRPDVVVFLDADNSDDPSELDDLVAPIERGEADLVIGSRALGVAEPGSLTWPQQFGNALASALIRRIWGKSCTDLGPFRAIRFDSLLALQMDDLDYGWTVQMQARAFHSGLRVVEVPVRYRRRIGQSKISGTVRGVICAGTKILTTIAREAFRTPMPASTRRALLVFTRYPEPGTTKTRLIAKLGALGAAYLQRQMTTHVLAMARNWSRHSGAAISVFFDGADSTAMAAMFGGDPEYVPQGNGSLGERLYRSVDAAHRRGMRDIIVIGSDCPSIDARALDSAFECLREHDIVLGPATDGGYYLIGMHAPIAELFDTISWGTEHVLAETLERCRRGGLSVALLEERHDIDTPADLPYWDDAFRAIADEKGYAPYLSVVIPTLNEERHISSTLESLGTANNLEIIVADGGSTDRTRTIAAAHGVRIVSTAPGRAKQMNAGAAIARGEVLLFLHADTKAPFGFSGQIKNCLSDPRTTIGAFRFALDDTRLSLRLIEFGVNARSKVLNLPFGDQGLFLRRTTFNEACGFRDLPIMEDYDLVARLGAGGRIRIVSTSAITSARRWVTHGILRTSLTNAALIIGWKLGVTPARLATWRSRKSHLNRKLEFPAPACEEPAKD